MNHFRPPGGLTAQRVAAARSDIAEAGWIAPGLGQPGTATVPDGGAHRFFERFPLAKKLASPDVFPLGVWLSAVNDTSDTAQDVAAGLNMYVGLTNNSNPDVAAASGLGIMLQADSGGGSQMYWPTHIPANQATAAAIMGWVIADEPDMVYGPTAGPPFMRDVLAQLPGNDGRFRFGNYGKGVGFWQTDQQAAQFVNLPQADVVCDDLYWFCDPDLLLESQGGKILYTDGGYTTLGDITNNQAKLGVNYGVTVQRLRRLMVPSRARPVWNYIELGQPMGAGSPTIAPAEMASATWHSIIAGATGIIYFNHSFGGTADTSNVLRDARYTTMRAAVIALNKRITALARVLNGPTVTGMCAVTAGSAKLLHKVQAGRHYLLVGSAARGSQPVTVTTPAASGWYATVVHENRSIPIVGGQFTDTFADHNAVHIYRLDPEPVSDPPPA